MKRVIPHYLILLLLQSVSFAQGNAFAQVDCRYEILFEENYMREEYMFSDGQKKMRQQRIIQINHTDDTLRIVFGMSETYFDKPDCSASLDGHTLKIDFVLVGTDVGGGIYEVDAPFENTYQEVEMILTGISQIPTEFYLNGRKIIESDEVYILYPAKFDVVEGDTLNRLDKYGQKQGRWIEKSWNFKAVRFFKDSKLLDGQSFDYYSTGELKTITYYLPTPKNGDIRRKRFYQSGTMKEEYYEIDSIGLFKKKWYKNHTLQQENFYTGKSIQITQYKEDGTLDCVCETKVGMDRFKGTYTCYNSSTTKVDCIFYDDNGKEIKRDKKELEIDDIEPAMYGF